MKLTQKVILSLATAASLTTAATLTVTSINNSGTGSLPAIIEEANLTTDRDTILFDITGGGTISTGIDFPEITAPVYIDGRNATGTVTLEGLSPNGPGAPASGLIFTIGSEFSTVRNIRTKGFLNAVYMKTGYITVDSCTFTNTFARAVRIEIEEGMKAAMLSRGNLIQNSTFSSLDALSIQVTNGYNVNIQNNTINAGAVIIQTSEFTNVGYHNKGNSFNGSTNGAEAAVILTGSRQCHVLGNSFNNQPGMAVAVYNNADYCDGNSVTSNNFTNNKGWDIKATGTEAVTIQKNTILGDAMAFEAGIRLEGTRETRILGNALKGARISLEGCFGGLIGGLEVDKNVITNDPQGFSGSAAILVTNSDSLEVVNNDLYENASNGIYLTGSNGTLLHSNRIHDNGRTGIKVVNGNRNDFRHNTIYNHHADAAGGINSISLLGDANDSKVAPTLTELVRSGNTITVKGTGTPGERIDVFRSTKPASSFSYDAVEDINIVGVNTDSTWSAIYDLANFSEAEFYATATATDALGNTSELAHVIGTTLTDGIAGPTEVIRGEAYTFSVQEIPGENIQWWVTGDASVTGNGTHQVEIRFFNPAGSVIPVNVGFQHPENGWTVHTLQVTIQ